MRAWQICTNTHSQRDTTANMDMDWAYTASGLAVGFVVGLTGVGGGALMTPLLTLGFGVSAAVAVGTDLLYAAVTKAGGAWVHGRQGSVDWRIAGWLALGSVPAAAATVLLLAQLALPPQRLSSLIGTALGAVLVATAAAMLLKEQLWLWAQARRPPPASGNPTAATVVTGVVVGALVTLTSVGAGALVASALLFLYPRMAPTRLVGTDIAHAVPLAAVAGLGHGGLGTVDLALLGSLLLGSLPGIALGSLAAHRVPHRLLRPALAGMLGVVGAKLIL
jgi:hypothetical protein